MAEDIIRWLATINCLANYHRTSQCAAIKLPSYITVSRTGALRPHHIPHEGQHDDECKTERPAGLQEGGGQSQGARANYQVKHVHQTHLVGDNMTSGKTYT